MSNEMLEGVSGEPIEQPRYIGVEITARFTREVIIETTINIPARGVNFEWRPATTTIRTDKYLTNLDAPKLYNYFN